MTATVATHVFRGFSHDSRPIHSPYGSWSSVCDRIALEEIALYGEVLSVVAAAGGKHLSQAEIDEALGVPGLSPSGGAFPDPVLTGPEEPGTQRPSSAAAGCVP